MGVKEYRPHNLKATPNEMSTGKVIKRGERKHLNYMVNKLDLMELLRQCPKTTISIGIDELNMFARQLLAESRREFEREQAAIEAGKAEIYREPSEVKEMLRISDSTLYRMAKSKILEPVFISGLRRYKQSDLEKLVSSDS